MSCSWLDRVHRPGQQSFAGAKQYHEGPRCEGTAALLNPICTCPKSSARLREPKSTSWRSPNADTFQQPLRPTAPKRRAPAPGSSESAYGCLQCTALLKKANPCITLSKSQHAADQSASGPDECVSPFVIRFVRSRPPCVRSKRKALHQLNRLANVVQVLISHRASLDIPSRN